MERVIGTLDPIPLIRLTVLERSIRLGLSLQQL